MRLDHLLSKEHVQLSSVYREITADSHTNLFGLDGAHGWNIDIDANRIYLDSVRFLLRKVVGTVWVVRVCMLHAVGS